ncbi:MAG: hypothetical protein R3C32_07805 [Chloroflexota bacterium]
MRCLGLYHLPAYAGVSADHEGSTAHAVLVEDGGRWMLLPVVLRDLDGASPTPPRRMAIRVPSGPTCRNAGYRRPSPARAGAPRIPAPSLFVRFHPLLNGVLRTDSGDDGGSRGPWR